MRYRAALRLPAVIAVLLITWGISINSFDVQEKARNILGFNYADQLKLQLKAVVSTTPAPKPKCGLSRLCPPDHFALHIQSGVANVIGPKICFEGKKIMSHVLNNVGSGLNVVVVNGQNGTVESVGYLNMQAGNPEDILAYLKAIKPGMIVLVASFDDVTKKMTDEIREAFVGMGSTLIKSVKHRDSWVFAGRVGTENKSLHERHVVNDAKTNAYEGWPEFVEVSGCFPKTKLTDDKLNGPL
ncbi:protein FAM3C isoform X1 [Sparus aurata]|uniref:FAM3 metabolism regulating signaling molecule D n=1 Tax=Sparus aurata TaxID=8175 RepID=A0A671W547_SPAAU|nr:protein FAM3C-like isoform X1 [Sparus aurata]XP_030274925.1 protein FAM3C-like isoform X1 [Sparus aurata]